MSLQNDYEINPASIYLATYVIDIYNSCRVGSQAGGQEFDTDKYNIILRGTGGPPGNCDYLKKRDEPAPLEPRNKVSLICCFSRHRSV